MAYRYVPILRTKVGETQALGELTPAAKARIFPLIAMTAAVPATFQPNAINRLGGFPIALDGTYNFSETGSAAAFTALFNGLGNGGIPVTPGVTFNPDPGYLAAVKSKVGKFGPSLVVQIALADLAHAHGWVTAQGWAPKDIDLIVMTGGVAELDPASFAGYVSHALKASIPAASPWRNVALNSWSAPKDHAALARGRNLVSRKDWLLWKKVHQTVPFQLDYSDMGHVHPSLDEVPGVAMVNATVSVRYAVDGAWIIIKGRSTTGPQGQPMGAQYRKHAQALKAEPQFAGIPGCWGDSRIVHYASVPGGAGGRPQWAAISLNRHISLVAEGLP